MSECKMTVEKCYDCPLVDKQNPEYTKVGKMLRPITLWCTATGNYIEITECINDGQGCPIV